MRIAGLGPTIRHGALTIAAVTLASLAAGCSTSSVLGGGESSSASSPATASAPAKPASTISQVKDVFFPKVQPPSPEERAKQQLSVAETTCPDVDVRQGTSTLVIPQGADALALRYQGTIADLARECNVAGGIMHIKVGVEGRLLVGPAGTPGQVEIPLRYAVVNEGPEPKTVVSNFVKFSVAIPEGQSNVVFSRVDTDIAFPMPPGLDINSYVVYVGFDPIGEKPQSKKPQKPQAKPARH